LVSIAWIRILLDARWRRQPKLVGEGSAGHVAGAKAVGDLVTEHVPALAFDLGQDLLLPGGLVDSDTAPDTAKRLCVRDVLLGGQLLG
jgi:hypothetical protein